MMISITGRSGGAETLPPPLLLSNISATVLLSSDYDIGGGGETYLTKIHFFKFFMQFDMVTYVS